MKTFVCSDIHGNIRALEAALAVYRGEYPCEFLFLGDVVGYGAHPAECLDRILELPRSRFVLGNHDEAALEEPGRPRMNETAAEAILWTKGRLDDRRRGAIRRVFHLEIENDRYLGVHGSPRNPDEWEYLHSLADAEEAFRAADFRLCFVGHTHAPAVFALGRGAIPLKEDEPVSLEPGERYLCNPGSVGQPRDGDPRAACLLFDAAAGTLTLRRCAYDIESEAADIRAAGLPAVLADRLLIGR